MSDLLNWHDPVHDTYAAYQSAKPVPCCRSSRPMLYQSTVVLTIVYNELL